VKNLTNNPGIVWLPYTIQTMAATCSSSFNPSSSITSRYSTVIIEAKNEKRKRKIRNILKEENHSI
jgi:hypothetical protein